MKYIDTAFTAFLAGLFLTIGVLVAIEYIPLAVAWGIAL